MPTVQRLINPSGKTLQRVRVLGWILVSLTLACSLSLQIQPTVDPTTALPEGRTLAPSLGMTEVIEPEVNATQASTEITALPTLADTPTPDPYASLTIEHLASRSYGGGELQVLEVLEANPDFARLLVSYPSDGLSIYGFMNVPKKGQPPFPVVIALHGYIDPGAYTTLDYTTRYADALTQAGFLVLHPNLRGYPPSDEGDNRFRVGMAVDVLNLIAIVREQGGRSGPLEMADTEAIGLWGHSMGGGVSIRVMTVSQHVKAVVLYGAMGADDRRNFERIYYVFSDESRGLEELNAPEEAFLRISPIYFLDRVSAAVSVHHGEADAEVPLEWSLDLCERLGPLGIILECFTYPIQPHTFFGDGDKLFVERTIEFLDRKLRRK